MKPSSEKKPDLSIVFPCLNEENTVGECIDEAKRFIDQNSISAEMIVVDNGSTDSSAQVAVRHGAKVITESRKGYGRAIRTGLEQSKGAVIIFADCDTTYDLFHLDNFYFPLVRKEYDMIIGDRFAGGIGKGAMPFLHKLGVPFLSFCGRLKFGADVRDFHCGLRAVTREALASAEYTADGMEFATEMIADASRRGLRIGQTPTVLRRCGARRTSKLRTFSDGFRHLGYIIRTRRKSSPTEKNKQEKV